MDDDCTWPVGPFLDQRVDVDKDFVMKRQNTELQQAGIMRSESGLKFGDGEHVHDRGRHNGITNGDQTMCFERTDTGRLVGEEAKGKTVRELSRLWRYQGGKSPE